MSFTDEKIRLLEVMNIKETMLSEIVVWLKAKGLWEECKKSLSVQITRPEKAS